MSRQVNVASRRNCALTLGAAAFATAMGIAVIVMSMINWNNEEVGAPLVFIFLLIGSAIASVSSCFGAWCASLLLPPILRAHDRRFMAVGGLCGVIIIGLVVALDSLLKNPGTEPIDYWMGILERVVAIPLLVSGLVMYVICRALISRHVLSKHSPNHCDGCGYDLRRLTSTNCPECGKPVKPESVKTVT